MFLLLIIIAFTIVIGAFYYFLSLLVSTSSKGGVLEQKRPDVITESIRVRVALEDKEEINSQHTQQQKRRRK